VSTLHPHLLDQRLRWVTTFVWLVLGVLLVAFFRTQILGHGKYQLQAQSNRLRPIPLPAPRGIIFDRNGKVLAENVPGYSVSLLRTCARRWRGSRRSRTWTAPTSCACCNGPSKRRTSPRW